MTGDGSSWKCAGSSILPNEVLEADWSFWEPKIVLAASIASCTLISIVL